MKLCIKQKVFSWRDRFFITDEYGNDKYYAEGALFTFGKELSLFSLSGERKAVIKCEMLSFTPAYRIEIEGKPTLRLVKKWSFKPRLTVEGLGWEITGDWAEHSYLATCSERTVLSVDKKWFSWGDCYMLDMPDGIDEIIALSVALGIDCINEDNAD